ncbi:hypothetical protein SEA_CLOWN_79 [Gordonia phage Clown]|uniref:Uncharacterized protein n=1 Tax=Gordonia phage Clown TaxID=2759393 RepID=A0A7L7SPJ8_9CAUD|nr:hypothetical protein KNV25_gp79 [Gordonia phage Clown]QOC56077.1 hypothetical protein SEA_CLOWN_79 [Gordonia phage Clown]
MYGMFALIDRDNVLEPEDHPSLQAAVVRANSPLWTGRRWVIVDPAGRYAATPSTTATPEPA